MVITGLQWDILESGPVFPLLSLLPFGSTADHCWIHACCASFWCGEDTQVLGTMKVKLSDGAGHSAVSFLLPPTTLEQDIS